MRQFLVGVGAKQCALPAEQVAGLSVPRVRIDAGKRGDTAGGGHRHRVASKSAFYRNHGANAILAYLSIMTMTCWFSDQTARVASGTEPRIAAGGRPLPVVGHA